MNRPSAIVSVSVSVALVALSGLGCATNPPQPSVPLGQPFELRLGTSATLPDGLKVTFDTVKSDSRCPSDAICVWAGEAVVALTLSQSAGGQVQRELRTTAGASETLYLTYVVKLAALAPYPRSAQQIRPEDYVATFTVDTR